MSDKSFFKNRAYLFELPSKSDSDKEFAQLILGDDKVVQSVELFNANFDYDQYKITTLIGESKKKSLLKISFDPNNILVKNDAFIAKQRNRLIYQEYNKNVGNLICFCLLDVDINESLEKYGESIIYNDSSKFFYDLKNSHSGIVPIWKFSNWLQSYLDKFSPSSFSPEALAAIKSHYDDDNIFKIFNSIESEILQLSSSLYFSKQEFCHGNLKSDNIYFNSGTFDFINYDYNFSGNSFIDIASLSINLGLQDINEKLFIEKYLNSLQKNMTIDLWLEYKTCHALMLRIRFLELFYYYLFEVFELDSMRPIEILKIIMSYKKSGEIFQSLPIIKSNIDLINKTLTESIIGNS